MHKTQRNNNHKKNISKLTIVFKISSRCYSTLQHGHETPHEKSCRKKVKSLFRTKTGVWSSLKAVLCCKLTELTAGRLTITELKHSKSEPLQNDAHSTSYQSQIMEYTTKLTAFTPSNISVSLFRILLLCWPLSATYPSLQVNTTRKKVGIQYGAQSTDVALKTAPHVTIISSLYFYFPCLQYIRIS